MEWFFFTFLSEESTEKLLIQLPATYSQHLSLQKSSVLHAASGVHMKQLAFDGRRVAWGQRREKQGYKISGLKAGVKFFFF